MRIDLIKRFCTLAILAILICLSACAVKQDEPVDIPMSDAEIKMELAGKVWVAEYLLGLPVVDMSHTSMVFSASDEVRGRGGCNPYGGNYSVKDGMISFGPMAATMRMCGKALGDQETRFFRSLAEPLTISFENGLLHLVPAGGEASIFAVQN